MDVCIRTMSFGSELATYIAILIVSMLLQVIQMVKSSNWVLGHNGLTTPDSGSLIVKRLEGNALNSPTDSCSRLAMCPRPPELGDLVENCFTNGLSKRRSSDLCSDLSLLGGSHSAKEFYEGKSPSRSPEQPQGDDRIILIVKPPAFPAIQLSIDRNGSVTT